MLFIESSRGQHVDEAALAGILQPHQAQLHFLLEKQAAEDDRTSQANSAGGAVAVRHSTQGVRCGTCYCVVAMKKRPFCHKRVKPRMLAAQQREAAVGRWRLVKVPTERSVIRLSYEAQIKC